MKIYNTMTRQKEDFIPVEQGKVKMYACGPTVYNYIHIGNARPLVVFDVVRRYFEYKGYEVNYVSNYTDIDDKIIKKANEEGVTATEIAKRYIREVEEDAKKLGVKKATLHPKATEEIPSIIEMIEDLIKNGHAYHVDGTVYFETPSFSSYGKLSGKNIDDLEAGKRIAVEDNKRNPSDFVLWKPKKEGEPAYTSPWGEGRPGWHIECSVMAKNYLGDQIDIHAGGTDLVFPHHENEIAQSEAANGKDFSKYWIHNGFINVDNKKMSKSTGNFFTVRDIVESFSYEIVRFFLLNAHYRSPINFSKDLMEAAGNGLERIKTGYTRLGEVIEKRNIKVDKEPKKSKDLHIMAMNLKESKGKRDIIAFIEKFEKAMDDDFNTADAMATVFDIIKYINTEIATLTDEDIQGLYVVLQAIGEVIGITYEKEAVMLDEEIIALIGKRTEAKKARDFSLADQIREDLLAKGIVLEDTREGVRYKRI